MKAEELRDARLRLGMTQVELAKALNVASDTVSRWERRRHRIPGSVGFALDVLLARRGMHPRTRKSE